MSVEASSLRRVLHARPAAAEGEQEDQPGRRWAHASSGRVALAQFAFCGMALLIVVATIGAIAIHSVARDEAKRDARALTAALSRGVVQPQLSAGVLAGDPEALARLDRVVRARILAPARAGVQPDNSIVRIKIWDTDGFIVYSDERRLVGKRFTLPEDLREALESRKASADVSDLGRPENRFERGRGRLVEVYQPMRVADRRLVLLTASFPAKGNGVGGGGPIALAARRLVLLEAYCPAKDIGEAGGRISRSFLPVLLAVLAALALAQIPLAAFLARRVRADERARERLTRAGEDALEGERRRIAAELHDGVVQDLAGVAYELQAVADRLPRDSQDHDLGAALRRGAGVCRGSMRALRALLVDLYPSERREQGLGAAVEALAGPLRERGVDVAVDMEIRD